MKTDLSVAEESLALQSTATESHQGDFFRSQNPAHPKAVDHSGIPRNTQIIPVCLINY